MNNELAEITDFIEKIPPFNHLPKDDLIKFVGELNINYLRKGDVFPPEEITTPSLYIMRKGALSYVSADNELIARYSEGELCREFCSSFFSNTKSSTQLGNENSDTNDLSDSSEKSPTKCHINVDEDTLVYHVDCQYIGELCQQHQSLNDYFHKNHAQRLKQEISQLNDNSIISSTLMNNAVSHFYNSPIRFIEATESIQQAAVMMTEQKFSCLMVSLDGEPVGMITDKDIRRRCVAQGLPITSPVSEIMTEEIISIDAKCNAHDALMTMTFKHIHHLPVTKKGKVVGMVTATDLMVNESHTAINLSALIRKASSVTELKEISLLLPKLQVSLTALGSNADHVGKSISALTMAFTNRLITMAQETLGEAPVPFAWLAAGSQSRQEQLVHTDQDNALIICDSMKPEDDAWFEKLAHFVCDGLAECGYIYCPGDNMATNITWRQPVHVWQKYFDNWIETPDPKALLNACIFFDLDTIHGDTKLLQSVRDKLLDQTKKNSLFITYLTKNALMRRPPLGFFRDFVLKANGKHKESLNLKSSGIAPIVDLARLISLALGIDAVNTIDRIKQASGSPILPTGSAESLLDAYEFITTLRLKHQADSLTKNEDANNYLSPKKLSKLEREHLKDAFKVIKTLQDTKKGNLYV